MAKRFSKCAEVPAFLTLAAMTAGCSGGPGGPTPAQTVSVVAPVITAVTPNTGSTGGGTIVKIAGAGFKPGASVTLGNERRTATFEASTTIRVTTPANAEQAVDVIVTNPGGETARLSSGYTYASPQSFDFNGSWVGSALAHPEAGVRLVPLHDDMDIRFTIEGNVLTSLTCGGEPIAMVSPLPSVRNGEFSLGGPGGAAISGRIVSAAGAVGTIDTAACPATRWAATKP